MLNNKTRIKLKWHLPAFGHAICLQRKKLLGWRTVAWIYPSVVEHHSCKEIEEWLFWRETYNPMSEKNIGKNILDKCRW